MIKVGILTYHRAKNYGAFLQAYGLCKRLNEESDIEAEIIDFYTEKEKKHYRLSRNPKYILKKYKAWLFSRKMYKCFEKGYSMAPFSNETCCCDDLEKFRQFIDGKYDIIIVGSDEVWKLNSFRGFPNAYWLPIDVKSAKVSYAASSRSDFTSLPKEKKELISRYLKDFEYITVRDKITYDQVKKNISESIKIEIMPDPSLTYDYKADYKNGRRILSERLGIKFEEKVAIVMTESDRLSEIINRELSNDYKLVSVYEYKKHLLNLPDITPFEWIDVIACADLVLASYFHAICFSIINNRRFLAFGTENKKSKLIELLSQMNLENHFVEITQELNKNGKLKELTLLCNKDDYNIRTEIMQQRQKMDIFIGKLREIGEKKWETKK